ncbi:ABC transporter ATP-binding protein [Companilactobacillus metriopterae]|uniref:ABC transporter ATP-binding protein n=1 Tax=Companilactobacillus metriopterae TaxID=1909267 RepID=UPI00100BEA51|nr:ABC transporter ATP-binding protein [Companilactobacillus metriopterae]
MENIISLTNISKTFGNKKVLDNITFQPQNGKIIGLIGPSGAGKSTIIKVLLGMEIADSGSAKVFGKTMPNRQLLSRIGYMAQSDALYGQLTAQENLEFYAEMLKISKQEQQKQIAKVAKIVDLTESLNIKADDYSGGMKRRLSLAIAMLGDKDLLILDEPTVGIDPALRIKIWKELTAMKNQGKTILVTTHQMDEAELVDEVAILHDGKIIAMDTPDVLKMKYEADSIEQVFLKAEGED